MEEDGGRWCYWKEDNWVLLGHTTGAEQSICKARSVPFAVTDEIEAELNHLESAGILVKVDYCTWAVAIITVLNKDGKIRICRITRSRSTRPLRWINILYPNLRSSLLPLLVDKNSPNLTFHKPISSSFWMWSPASMSRSTPTVDSTNTLDFHSE